MSKTVQDAFCYSHMKNKELHNTDKHADELFYSNYEHKIYNVLLSPGLYDPL